MTDEMYYKYFGVYPIHTSGTAEGVILKYPHFYLKIYNESGMNYLVQGFCYGDQNPRFEDHVKFTEMIGYGSEWKKCLRRG